ncbi:MAG: dephospho-CoA kinase [Culicoidibacterales bacterium]
MKLIGLTGSIATGKSTVTAFLRTCGLPVIDTDAITQQLQQNPEVIQQLVDEFGPTIREHDGSLNRAALGTIIFQDAEQRKRLDACMHPLIKAEMLKQAIATQSELVILDVPLLFETDYYQLCEQIIVVTVDEVTQLQRLIQRDHCSNTVAQTKIASQLPIAQKVAKADYIIDNRGSLQATQMQVRQLVDKLKVI